MNILIVSQYFWPENFRINDLAVGMRERGHRVTVLTGIPNYPQGRYYDGYGLFRRLRQDFQGVRVRRVPLIPRGKAGGLRLALNYLSFAATACLAAPLLRGRYDVIFVFEPSPVTVGLPALLLGRLQRAPILFWVLDLWPESLVATDAIKSPAVLRLVGLLVRFIYRRCDRVLVQSRAFVPAVVAQGAAAEDVRYFPSWVEDVYRPLPRLAEDVLPALPEGFRILFAGNVGAAQDFESVLVAVERLREHARIHWLIVGDGRRAAWLREEVGRRGLTGRVHLLGPHPLERMPAFFAAADALLVSLKRAPIFALTIPGKVQSYLACGRPILAMLDGEGARVVEEAGAGLTCPAEDGPALAENVLALAALPASEREAYGRRGREYYEKHFDRRMLFDRLESWMREVTGKDQ